MQKRQKTTKQWPKQPNNDQKKCQTITKKWQTHEQPNLERAQHDQKTAKQGKWPNNYKKMTWLNFKQFI